MKSTAFKIIKLWLPVILWTVLIFNFSNGKVFVASEVYWQDFTVKKLGHVLLFGFLAILTYRALRGEKIPRKKALAWAIIFSTLYGASDEYHQSFTQGRESRIRDVFIDGVGAAISAFVVYEFLPKVPKKIKIYFDKLNLT